MVSVQQLIYFSEVVRQGSVSSAATSLGVRQPTISQQIKALELILGTQLFVRTRNGMITTPIGAALAEQAHNILIEIEKFSDASKTIRSSITLSLGIVPSVGAYLFELIMPELGKVYGPRLISVREALYTELMDDLNTGIIDCAIMPFSTSSNTIQSEILFTEELLILMPRSHRLARQRTIKISDLQTERDIFFTLQEGHQLHEQTKDFCQRNNIQMSNAFECSSLDTLKEMVACGLGLTLIPYLYVRSEVQNDSRLVVTRFCEITLRRPVSLVYKKFSLPDVTCQTLQDIVSNTVKRHGLT